VIDERNGQTSLRICRKQRSWEPLPSGFLENVVFLAKITPYKATSLLPGWKTPEPKRINQIA